ncbi:mtDNA inheritance, partitioning of the mitochondrial organelle [Recurvomyces mirabilis]|nr:mtDNA inheritance, partitioning of the mitochondrial organelle [Recurvomyces mirabilis]
MHEVITLQFGQQANYLGTHYWNIQESYFTYAGQEESPVDHDISFRPGIGANGEETYSPRTLLYDLKGAFGTLRRENALYQLQEQTNPAQQNGWSGATIPLQLPAIQPSSYQQALDQGTQPPQLRTDTVRFWSDYNHVYYHPRSIVQLNDYELNSALMPFERWDTGEELFASLDREHDLLDRDLRPFLEECDQVQGLQIFTGIDDAWGGFAAKYLERIADDMGKGCRWVVGLQDGTSAARSRQITKLGNAAQSILALNTSASMHLPLSSAPSKLPAYLNLDATSRWHTAALQAASVESLTLPTRLRMTAESGRATFDRMETALSNEGNRRIGATALSLGQPEVQNGISMTNGHRDSRMSNGVVHEDADDAGEQQEKLDMDLSPSFDIAGMSAGPSNARPHVFGKTRLLRGHLPTEEDQEAELRGRIGEGPRVVTYHTDLLFPSLSSFPPIVRSRRAETYTVKVSVATDTTVAARIRSLENHAQRIVGVDEREALCDGLASMAEEYEAGWSDDEDYGED